MAAPGVRLRQRGLLRKKLQDSNRRFARIMSTLVAKYNRPFEEDQLVHIATLTYQTPDGLREWGGRIVTQQVFQNIQTSLEKEGYNIDDMMQSTFTDVKSNRFNVTSLQRDDTSLKNDSLQSLPENDLDKKCMTRVDVILEDDHPRLIMFDSFGKRKDLKPPVNPSVKEGPKALPGCSHYGTPLKPTAPPRVAPVSPNQSLLAWRSRRNNVSCFLGDTTFEEDDSAQDLTLSDIYAEMLCSLCRCLPSQKLGLVSTNKYISKGWFPKKRRLNITLTMESSFLKVKQKFQLLPGEKSHLVCRKDYKQNFLPCSESDTVVKDGGLSTPDLTHLARRGALHGLSTPEVPPRTMEVRQAAPSPSRSHTRSPVTPRLSLPPALTSAKERSYPLPLGAPAGAALWQERHLPRSPAMSHLLQTPKSTPTSHERLCQERSASSSSEMSPKSGFARRNLTKARKSLPFGLEHTPCKARDVIDSMFDTYAQGTAQWAQELLFLKKSGQKSRVLPRSKCEESLETSGPWASLQAPQKAASPRGTSRDSLCEIVSTLHLSASPRDTLKGSFSSPTKRRKVSSSQTWDRFSSSEMRDKARQTEEIYPPLAQMGT
ncbi:Holliday junction recognition protein isoform X2 [Dromiciops gliroides]|uniref:Holliday junction recognition protein isoform X2 n=1 Tax=Dromiciops gliroides TaxID=33562 RepID=UPI001CC72CCD|nr:Holliday junction recognition protein isoform X2 [Dromiciops gliroides]